MPRPAVTEADIRWMHDFLCLTTPFDAMPPALRQAVESAAAALLPRLRRRLSRLPAVDFKRRAAGDLDD